MVVSDSAMSGNSHKQYPKYCYLCGESLTGLTSKDHCPPRALFARKIRQQFHTTRLVTIDVHPDCNSSYKRDEEYFQATLAPLALGSIAGDATYQQFIAGAHKSKSKMRLAKRVLREFEPRPSGLHLPPSRIVKRQEGKRITRVLWKISRGLYFHEHSNVLTESTRHHCTITPPGQRPPETFERVRDLPDDETYGRYPGVFDYRFRVFEHDQQNILYWSFLIWDRIIAEVWCHNPEIISP